MNFIEIKTGKSVEGDPIPAFVSEDKASDYIYLIAGIHGDEVEGVYILQQLFSWLKKTDDVKSPLLIIPVLNVDGHRHGTRVNAHGVDLNRNFNSKNWKEGATQPRYNPGTAPLTEPEGQFLVKLFQKYPPKIVMAIHSWKPLVNFDGKGEKLANFLSSYNGYEVGDTIGYETPGSLGEYVPEKYNCPVITLECPTIDTGISFKEIWAQNEKGLKEFLLTPDQYL